MAKMLLDDSSSVLTKEKMEDVRFVQNWSRSLLMIPDLGKKGVAFHPDEIADLTKSFTKKEIGGSQNLAWAIKEGHLRVLKYEETEKGIELDGVKEERDKFQARGEALPKNVPVEDRTPNDFDKKLDDKEDADQAEEDETKPGRRNRAQRAEATEE